MIGPGHGLDEPFEKVFQRPAALERAPDIAGDLPYRPSGHGLEQVLAPGEVTVRRLPVSAGVTAGSVDSTERVPPPDTTVTV